MDEKLIKLVGVADDPDIEMLLDDAIGRARTKKIKLLMIIEVASDGGLSYCHNEIPNSLAAIGALEMVKQQIMSYYDE